MRKTSYVIALGSNRRHHRFGDPRHVLSAAIEKLEDTKGIKVQAVAPVFITAAVGPAGRAFANSALLLRTAKSPSKLLKFLKGLERDFGRRRSRRWGPRVLDLDIILWSGGLWIDGALAIPHPGYRQRRFVLDPLIHLVPEWRDPLDGLTVRQRRSRLIRPRPVDRRRPAA